MSDCIFCKVVAGELPSYKVYEDRDFYVLLDIHPRTKGHALVIPKKHYRWVYDVPDFSAYWNIVLKLTKAMQKALSPTFVTYVTHGLEVEHAHIHVMPRYKETEFVPSLIDVSKNELTELASKIRKAIEQ
ncbi:HIT family protein [Candidatus Roizmanbacteria bacterium]|nr:HIT family protein [Candidatus Roizmanbacteria bacterium]